MELELPLLLASIQSDKYLTPEQYTYWKARENRTFYIDYEIDEDYSLVELGKILIQMNMEEKDIPKEELKPIYLWIYSYGGDLDQCNSLLDIIAASRIPVVTISMGVCMSAGFMLFLSGHRRYAFRHANMMVHEGSAAFSGTAEQIEEAQKNYKKQISGMKEYILSRTEMDEKTFTKNKSKDWYLTVDELEKFKVATIIDSFEDII